MPASDDELGPAHALIIATGRYEDPGLSELRSPPTDADQVASVLEDPAIGGYNVRTLLNESNQHLGVRIEDFFAERRLADRLLLYVSCHGVKDQVGQLYFAATNTKLSRLASTGISAEFVRGQMDRCRSRRVLMLLDCCYSGAYRKGHRPRAVQRADIGLLSGRGKVIITSCTQHEYALEIDTGEVSGTARPSVFTAALVKGLRTGEADRDRDGFVSVDELYEYIFDRVREKTTDQTPEMWGGVSGNLIIFRNPQLQHPVAATDDSHLSEARREADEAAKRRAGEQARREADEAAKRRAGEQARREADEAAKRRAEEEALHSAISPDEERMFEPNEDLPDEERIVELDEDDY
jgi:uncharacterized caspase-like protein